MDRPWVLPLLIIVWFSAPESVSCQDVESVNITLKLNNESLIVVMLPKSAVDVLGMFLTTIFSVTPGNTSFEILACKSPDLHTCPENSTCIELSRNTAAFDCLCEPGLIYNGSYCIEDPCSGRCNNTQQCDITIPACVCADGFVDRNGSCEVSTPCYRHECPEHSVCNEVDDTTYNCTCNGNGGYKKTGGGNDKTLVCVDVDECNSTSLVCHQNASCENTEGSFLCICNVGYTGDGKTCNDIDECLGGGDSCHAKANCKNTPGSHECTCMEGYSGNGMTCDDIDECDDNNGGCDTVNGICENVDGSFSCSCQSGYTGDGLNCTDIDECEDLDTCDTEKTCVNLEGSHRCFLFVGITITLGTSGRRKRSTTAQFENDFEEYLRNVLSTNVNVTITEDDPLTLGLDADPSYKEAIEYVLAKLPGRSIGGRTIASVTYPTEVFFAGKITTTATDADNECGLIEDHIKDHLGLQSDAPVRCNGVLNAGELTFNVTVQENSDLNLTSILSSYSTNLMEDSCVCNDEKTTCTVINGRPRCHCQNSYHDANFTSPGTDCVNPISNVACGDNAIGATLYANYFYRIGLSPNSLHLMDTSCTGMLQGEWLVFNSSTTTCGTTTNHTAEKVVYANAVTNMYFPGEIQTADPSIKFDFTCCYPTEFGTGDDTPPPLNVVSATVITQTAQGDGTMTVTVTIYMDSSFTTPLQSGAQITPGDTIYVLAEHSATVQPNYLKFRSCYLTPTEDPNDITRLQLIENACPRDFFVGMLRSGVGENASFALTSIKFQETDQFYLHCDVKLCNELCNNETCTPEKRRRRRDTDENIATLGPIEFAKTSDIGETSSPSSSSAGGAVGAVVGCLAAVAVVVFIVWKRKQSSSKSSKYSDSNLPSATYYNSGFSSQTVDYADCPSRISRRN